MQKLRRNVDLDLPNSAEMSQVERLRAAFDHYTLSALSVMENELALSKALGDEDETVKHHIKIGMLRHARELFDTSYIYATRKEVV